MKRTSRNMKDLNMTTARRTGCQSKEKLTTTTAVAEKRRSTRRPGATQDWRWARSKTIRGRHQDDPTRNRPTRGPIARNRPRGTLSPSRSKWETNELLYAGANHEKLSTRDISNELLQVGDEPHAGANNEKLSTRDISNGFSTRETSPTRGPITRSCPRGTLRRTSCPTRGPTTRSFPHGALMNECLTRELTTRSCPCGTLMNERLHAGANNETLPTRGTRYDKEPQGPHRVGLRGHPRRRPRRRRRRPRRR